MTDMPDSDSNRNPSEYPIHSFDLTDYYLRDGRPIHIAVFVGGWQLTPEEVISRIAQVMPKVIDWMADKQPYDCSTHFALESGGTHLEITISIDAGEIVSPNRQARLDIARYFQVLTTAIVFGGSSRDILLGAQLMLGLPPAVTLAERVQAVAASFGIEEQSTTAHLPPEPVEPFDQLLGDEQGDRTD